jgi:hypothetical protein
MSIRPVKRIIESKLTIEGAGVKLRRAFAASRARPATMPLAESCVTSSASASPGFDSACKSSSCTSPTAIMSNWSQARFLEPSQGKQVT